jgi:hypothetical protein
MDYNVELRYYEILFQKLILSFHHHYTLDRLTTFMELLSYLAESNTSVIGQAMQRILTNDTLLRYNKIEYIICLKLCTDFKDVDIRRLVKCSPNTIGSAMQDYADGSIFIQPRFPLQDSDTIRTVMKKFREIANVY